LIGLLRVQIFNMNKEITKLTLHLLLCMFLCGTDKLMSVLHSRRGTCFESQYALTIHDWKFIYWSGSSKLLMQRRTTEFIVIIIIICCGCCCFCGCRYSDWKSEYTNVLAGKLAPCIRVVLHMLMALQLINKFNHIVEPRQLITLFSRTRAWSLAWTEPNQSLTQTDNLLLSDTF